MEPSLGTATGPVTTSTARGRPVLTVLLLASTLGVMGGAAIAPMIEVIRQELDISSTAVGVLLTTHSLAIAVTSPLVGRLCDRLGPRRPLAAGLVLFALGGGSGLVTDSYPVLLACRVLLGIGCAAIFTCSTVAVLALHRGPERDRVLGWRTTAISAGGFVYPVAAGALGNLSWQSPFAVYLIGLPLGIATFLTLPRQATGTEQQSEKNENAENRENRENTESRPDSETTSRGGAFQLLREYPALLALGCMWVATAALMMVIGINFPRRLDDVGIHNTLLVAVYGMVFQGAAAGLVGLVFVKVRTWLSYSAMLRLAAGLWAVAFVLFALADSAALLVLVPLLTGAGNGLVMPSATALIARIVPADKRGLATSLQATAMFGGQFVSPLLFGRLIDATSVTVAALSASGGTVVMLAALFFLKTPPEKDETHFAGGDETEPARARPAAPE